MTRHLKTAFLTMALAASCAFTTATAQPSDADRVNPLAPGIDDAVTLVDDNGQELAVLTVTSVTDDWTDYPQNHKPRTGVRYLGIVVEAESLTNGVELDSDDFDLQIDPGMMLDAASVQTTDDDAPVLKGEIDLDKGDTATFVLVYAVPEDAAYSQLFWGDDDVVITIYSAASE